MDTPAQRREPIEHDLRHLHDRSLMQRLHTLAARQRRVCAALLAVLAEVDARGLYREQACASMFSYCVERLQMSEPEAYLRIRAARRYPVVFDMVQRGALHLTALKLLSPVLDDDNHAALLQAAAFKSRRQLEQLLAERFPRADVPSLIRKLPSSMPVCGPEQSSLPQPSLELAPDAPVSRPAATDGEPKPPPSHAPVLSPLSSERFKVQFTADRQLRDKLQTARQLLAHQVPNGDLSRLLERALDLLIDQQMKQRFAATDRPRARRKGSGATRHIPAQVKREVAERDGLRCSFVDNRGRRCTERAFLEFHHRNPYGRGGLASTDNIALVCRAHNGLLAERDYGKGLMADRRQRARAPN